jgi:hypothetical protein
MRAEDLDQQSHHRRRQLDEKPTFGDTVKSTAKSLGSRVGNQALAAAGGMVGRGGKAHGRLVARIMADNMLQAWLQYQGASNQPATRSNIFQFLRRQYSRALDDNTLLKITGAPRPRAPRQPPAANTPPPAASPPPAPQTATAPIVPQTPAQPVSAPLPTPPVAQPVTASPVPVQPALTPDGRQKLTPAQYQDMVKQAGGNPNRITPAMVDQQAGAAQPVPAAPAQPTLPGASSPPQPPAAGPPAPAPRNPSLVSDVFAAARQPNVNSGQIMQMIANRLRQAQEGPEKQNMIATIRAMQKNPKIAARVPELSRLALESWMRSGVFLFEKAPEEELSRSELDSIFVQTANQLVIKGKLSNGQPSDQPPSSSPPSSPPSDDDRVPGSGSADAFEQAKSNRITYVNLANAAKGLRSNDKTQLDIIATILKDKMSSNTTLAALLRQVERDDAPLYKRLRANVKQALTKAAQ